MLRKLAVGALLLTACGGTAAGPATTAPLPSAVAPTTTGPGTVPGSATPTTGGGNGSTAPATSGPASSAPAADLSGVRVALRPVLTATEPVAVRVRPGDPTGLWIAERGGRVVRVAGGQVAVALSMETLTSPGGERGLLGIAFSPSGDRLYASYTDVNGDSRLDEYVLDAAGKADPATRRPLLFQKQPFPNHNGGNVVTGPDGMLYLGFGDGGAAGDPNRVALDDATWLGKLLRIDPRPSASGAYTVPPDNPFVGVAGAKPEIWASGLRNPWRFSFDPATGDLWIADVGQDRWEEVDLATAASGAGRGASFGWSAFEGTHPFNADQQAPGAVPPVHEYPHGDLGCSISGGAVYRGTAIPALAGAYVFSDYCSGGLRAFPATAGPHPDATVLTTDGKQLVDVATGPDGELYVSSLGGTVYQVVPA